MSKKRKLVTLNVSPLFFDNIFEPERKSFERKIGTRVSQKAFTEILAKQKITLLRRDNKFLGKEHKKK